MLPYSPLPVLFKTRPLKAQSSNDTRVRIDTDRVIGEIDPKIYGNFTEHLGRCIEGGIFEPNSPLSDKFGFRKDVLHAVEDLHVTLLRWPGGNFSSNYNWRDGIGPVDRTAVAIGDGLGHGRGQSLRYQ